MTVVARQLENVPGSRLKWKLDPGAGERRLSHDVSFQYMGKPAVIRMLLLGLGNDKVMGQMVLVRAGGKQQTLAKDTFRASNSSQAEGKAALFLTTEIARLSKNPVRYVNKTKVARLTQDLSRTLKS